MTLPELAIRRHVTTLMSLVSLAVLGAVALARLPMAFLPDMDEPEIFVHLPYPNSVPEQVQNLIVRPVEDALGSVRGLKSMWSRCDEDGGVVRLEFDWDVNLHVARVEVWEKLDRIRRDLPEDMEDLTVGDHWRSRESDNPVLEGRLSSELDLSESYDRLERRIVRPLQRVPGVAQVRLDGVQPKEVHINLRLADLERHNMDVREVARILRSSNFDQSLGEITNGERRFVLRTLASFRNVEEIRDLVLRGDGLLLCHVADVVYEEPKLEFGRHLDGNFAVGVTVSAEARANSVAVCEALQERIASMDSDPELRGVNFLVWFSEGREIKKALYELFSTGVFGALLASLVLFFFLRRFSTTVVCLVCIPFSLVVTCGFIWAQGKTLNTLSLLGLIVGIGMLVDNAVVVMENIFRHQELGEDRTRASRIGAREVSTAVIAATLTSVIVFVPIVFDKPSEMSIPLKEIGVTVCITLLVSLFISQTFIPLATSWFLHSQPRPRGRWLVGLENLYGRVLDYSFRHRWLTPLVLLTIALSAIYPFRHVDINFDQERSRPYAEVHYNFSEQTPIEHKEALVTRIEKLIDPHREELLAKSIYSYWSDGHALTRVYLHDGESSEENLALVRLRLRELLPEVAGVRIGVSDHHRHWHRNRGKRIAVQLLGENPDILGDLAGEVTLRLAAIPGLEEALSRDNQRQQELHVESNRDLLERYRLTTSQLAETVGLTFRGRRLQRFRTADGEREMRLTLDEREDESVNQLTNLPVRTSGGERVPLAAIADFTVVPGRERIEREGRQPSVWVGARYQTGTREDYVPQVTAALNAIEFPEGYSWTFGDWETRRTQKSKVFLINLVLALLLIFAVMAGLFESVQQAVALMVALPFALTGAIWALHFIGIDFDQPAAVGLLLLIGIVVNNGIVMVEHMNGYRRQGMPRIEAMLRGGRERLRPILMTALTTIIGLVPILVQKPSFGGVTYYSMAVVVMGGIVVSTFLTAVLLPTTVTLVEDFGAFCGRRLRRKSHAGELESSPSA